MSRIFIGTSGWSYADWKDGFYTGVPRRHWLEYYAQMFDAVEVNATFYGALKPATLKRWHDETPANFCFAVKASRFITHLQRLATNQESLSRMRGQAEALGGKLAAVLWQAPAALTFDLALLERFCARLDRWSDTRHAIEFRDKSWFREETASCLKSHRVAAVQSHAADWPMWGAVTTDLVYVRLHGGRHTYRSAYSKKSLADWASRIRRWLSQSRTVHVYFDNTDAGHAAINALRLKAIIGS